MDARLDYGQIAPDAMKAMSVLDRYSKHCGLEASLMELIKLRASQINGCGYCIDMHSKDARTLGESEQRLYGLNAWQEAPYYTDRERAALALTEAVTLIADGHVSDEVYHQARRQFSDEDLVKVVMAIVTINAWNRLGITFRDVPGSYQPEHAAAQPVHS